MSGGEQQDGDAYANAHCRRVQVNLSERQKSNCSPNENNSKESSTAVEQPQKLGALKESHIGPIEEQVEVIKVYLETKPETAESVRMLTDEVSQIQEVRYCLKTLREQMAARQNGNNNKHPPNGFRVHVSTHQVAVTNDNAVLNDTSVGDNQESTKLREATKRVYAQLKEMEKRHQEERERLQSESKEYRGRLAEQAVHLRKAEEQSEEKEHKMKELQRLLESMEVESDALKEKMAAGEAELLQLRADREEGQENKQRCEELEREVAGLREKIHHLDDMLRSQQRKVRHMIEQLQNSRTILQERERTIRDLEEKVAFLEAENKELHDHMEYFLEGQDPLPLSTDNKPEIVYSKPLTPMTQGNKVLPFIKVIEIKS